jgi:hypothetical protein
MFGLFETKKPDLKADESLQILKDIDRYLRQNRGDEVRNKVFDELNHKLGLDIKGKFQEFIYKKVFDWAFRSQLPHKIMQASFNLFRNVEYSLIHDGKNPYSAKLYPEQYVDFMIWTWQNKGYPWYQEKYQPGAGF